MTNKLFSATGLAAIGWLSVFAMSWLFVLGEIKANLANVLFWIFFFIIAFFASSFARGRV